MAGSYKHGNELDMVKKPTNAYKRLRLPCIINIECLLHVSATFVAILREMRHKGYITIV
jgi:hypothetical protein